jgi:predicted  nucleic acid-binding Zn-ribbon protein
LIEKSDAVNQEEELLQLSSEVKTLKDVNEKKEMELQNISKEYQEMKAKGM